MSKMDNLRAMREARYEAAAARAKGSRTARPALAPPVAPLRVVSDDEPPPQPVAVDEQCGHRNISGRTCTRERGHSAKSHRYS